MALDKNLSNDYDPKLISDVTERFQNDSGALLKLLSDIDINNIDELSEMRSYYDMHRECADVLQTALSKKGIFLDTESTIDAIRKLKRDPVNSADISDFDFKNIIDDTVWRLEDLKEKQNDIIQCANQYSDYETSASEVINNLNDYQRLFKDIQKRLNKVTPLLTDKRVFKRTDLNVPVLDTAPRFKIIEGQIDANALKKRMRHGTTPIAQTFVSNLVEADKLLHDQDIKYIDSQLRDTYDFYFSIINDHTLTFEDVENGAKELKERVDFAGVMIQNRVLDLVNKGDLSGALAFVKNIQKKHSKFAKKIDDRRLQGIARNPIRGVLGYAVFNELDGNEVIAMWQDAIKHGFRLNSYDLYRLRDVHKAFFSIDGKYYVKINQELFQWDSSSQKLISTENSQANIPTPEEVRAATEDPKVSTTRSGSVTTNQNEKANNATTDQGKKISNVTAGRSKKTDDGVYLLPNNTDTRSELKAAGIQGIKKRIVKEKWIRVNGTEHEKWLEVTWGLPDPMVQKGPYGHRDYLFPDTADVASKLRDAGISKISKRQIKGESYIRIGKAENERLLREKQKLLGHSSYEVLSESKTYRFLNTEDVQSAFQEVGISNVEVRDNKYSVIEINGAAYAKWLRTQQDLPKYEVREGSFESKVYRFPYDEHMKSILQKAGISDINKRIVDGKYVDVYEDEYKKMLKAIQDVPDPINVREVESHKSGVYRFPYSENVKQTFEDAGIAYDDWRAKGDIEVRVDEEEHDKALNVWLFVPKGTASVHKVYLFSNTENVRKKLENAGVSNIDALIKDGRWIELDIARYVQLRKITKDLPRPTTIRKFYRYPNSFNVRSALEIAGISGYRELSAEDYDYIDVWEKDHKKLLDINWTLPSPTVRKEPSGLKEYLFPDTKLVTSTLIDIGLHKRDWRIEDERQVAVYLWEYERWLEVEKAKRGLPRPAILTIQGRRYCYFPNTRDVELKLQKIGIDESHIRREFKKICIDGEIYDNASLGVKSKLPDPDVQRLPSGHKACLFPYNKEVQEALQRNGIGRVNFDKRLIGERQLCINAAEYDEALQKVYNLPSATFREGPSGLGAYYYRYTADIESKLKDAGFSKINIEKIEGNRYFDVEKEEYEKLSEEVKRGLPKHDFWEVSYSDKVYRFFDTPEVRKKLQAAGITEFNELVVGEEWLEIDEANCDKLRRAGKVTWDLPKPHARKGPSGHKEYLFIDTENVRRTLQRAGISDINERIVDGRYIRINEAEYEMLFGAEKAKSGVFQPRVSTETSRQTIYFLPDTKEIRSELRAAGISNIGKERILEKQQISINGAELEKWNQFKVKKAKQNEPPKEEKPKENRVVASARLRLDQDKDKTFRDTITRLSSGKYSIVFYDIETTSNKPMDKSTDIIQIGAVKYSVKVDSNGKLKFTKIDEFNRYIWSDRPISKGAQRTNSITKEDLRELGEDKNKVLSDFIDFIRGATYTMGFNNRDFDDYVLARESSYFFENNNSFKTLDFRDLASLDYDKGFRKSSGTLEDIFNILNDTLDESETHDARDDAEMVANALNMLLNQLNVSAKSKATAGDQDSGAKRKFTIQQAWRDSKKHRVEFIEASHTYKLHIGAKIYDVDTSVTSYISQFIPRSYDENKINSKMRGISDELQDIYNQLANAIMAKMHRDYPGDEIPDFVRNTSEPFRYIDACFECAHHYGVDTTTLNDKYVKLCARLNETKPDATKASTWGTQTHEFIQAIEYYFAISGESSFSSFVRRITDLYKHWQGGKVKPTGEDAELLEAIKNSKGLPEESKNMLENNPDICLLKINSGALDNWLEARKKLHIRDSQKVELPPNGQQENHFVAKITDGQATQYVGASVDLIFKNYQDDRMMLIDLKATSGSNARTYGAQVSLYKQIIAASGTINIGKIDANVVYLPQVKNGGMVEFDNDIMSNEEFIRTKMIANVNHDFTGMEIGELSEVLLDKINPSWKKNILKMSQGEIESRVQKISYYTIGDMTFSDWADVLGNYVKYAFIVHSQINSPRITVDEKDLGDIEDALGIINGAFDFEHIESYLLKKDKVCEVLKKYGYTVLADNFNIAAGHIYKFINGVLETYISDSSEGTKSENAYRMYLMAGSQHGDTKKRRLREALASIIYHKYGEDIEIEQQKNKSNRAHEYRGVLSDNAEGIVQLISTHVNYAFINNESFLALTDEEKRNKYVDSLFENLISDHDLLGKLSDTYRSIRFDDVNEGNEAAHDFIDWLNGWNSRSDKIMGSGDKAFYNLITTIGSRLKEYITDCVSKDLVIDQLSNAAKYVAQELENLFKDYCATCYGFYRKEFERDYTDSTSYFENSEYLEDKKAAELQKEIEKNLRDAPMPETVRRIRRELWRLTREYVGGMYNYLLAPLNVVEKEDQYWSYIAKEFGAHFAELTEEYFDLHRNDAGTGYTDDFHQYVSYLEDFVEESFGDIAWLRYVLQKRGIDYSSPNIANIYLKRLALASSYKHWLSQHIHAYQTTIKAAMTKLAKMVSLHTTIIGGTTMTVGKIGNRQIREEQRVMGLSGVIGIVKEISRLINSLPGQKSEWSSRDKKKIAEKLRELLEVLFELQNEAQQKEKSMGSSDPEAVESLMEDIKAAADQDDDTDARDKPRRMESGLVGLNMHAEEFDDKLWRDINEILRTLVDHSDGELKFAFYANKEGEVDEQVILDSVEHFIKQFLDWQEWYGEDDGRKTSIALQLGALSGSNGAVRVTGEQVQNAFNEIYELSQTNEKEASKELNKYLKLFTEYCTILKNEGKENTFEFKDIINAFARNGYMFLNGEYRRYRKESDIFHRGDVDIPKAIGLFNDMIYLRTMLVEPLSIIQGILLRTQGTIESGEQGRKDDRMRRNSLLYLKSFREVFNNIFSKFAERNIANVAKILDQFPEIIKLIDEINDLSEPKKVFRKVNTCLNSIINAAKKLIQSTINANEHIVQSLQVYMEYARSQQGASDISSKLMRGGNSMTFDEMKTLIRDFLNAGSNDSIYFSQNEFKKLETADYIFDARTIKSLISKGIIVYDPEKLGYFLEGVRIPKEMLPEDLKYSTEKLVFNEERGDFVDQLNINGDINTILMQFLEGLKSLTDKLQEIVSTASGESKNEGSKGTSSEGGSGKNADEKKDSSEDKKDDKQKDTDAGKEQLDRLRSYIELLEKEKRILKEIKGLEGDKTAESIAQINAKRSELNFLDKQKEKYTDITDIVGATAKSSAEERQKKIDEVASKVSMSDDQKKKFSENMSKIFLMESDANQQDSPDKVLSRMYQSEMRGIYQARMEADDKEFRYMQAMQKAKDPSVKAAYNALIGTQRKNKEEILKNEEKTHQKYAGLIDTKDAEGNPLTSESIRRSLQAEDDTNRSVKMNEILSQNPPKTYASQLEDAIKGSVRTFSLFSIVTRIMYKFMNSLRQCVNTMKELDKVQMDLRVVTGNSKEGIQELTKSYSELGFKLGLTTKEVAQSANTWLRQGYSISETNKLIEATAKLSKLGMVDAASASRYLTSAIKGFHMEASEAESVVDRLVTLDMKYAASAGDIAQALARVSAVAQSSNTSLNETTAMLTTMIDVSQQGAESVGDALKTMMSRFGNVKAGAFTKLMDSEDSENLNDIERVLNSIGITVRQSTMQMKSFSSVLDELYEKWDQLSNVEQNAIATAFAGQRQRNFFLLLMQNEESYRQALETTENAQGQAAEKYLAYMESYEYAAQQVKNAWEQITQLVFENDAFIWAQKGLARLIKNLPTLIGAVTKITAAIRMYRAPTMFSNIAAKLLPDMKEKDPNAPRKWSRTGGINRAREYSEHNSLLNIKTLVEKIFGIEERREQRETHKENAPEKAQASNGGNTQPGKTSGGAQAEISEGGTPVNVPTTETGSPESGTTPNGTDSGAPVGKRRGRVSNWFARKIRKVGEKLGATDQNSPDNIMAQEATYAALLSGISTAMTGTSSFDWALQAIGKMTGSESWGDVKRTGSERALAGGVSAVGTGVGAYFGGTAGAMIGSGVADIFNTFTKFLFHYEEVQRLDRVKTANKIIDVLNSIDDSVKKATNAVSINAAERTAGDWQSIYKTRDEMQLAVYQLASEDIDKNGKGAFLFLNNFLEENVPRSLENAIAKLDELTGSTDRAQKVMQDFGAAYQVAKAEAEYAALESEIEEINKKLGEDKYVLGQAYLDATTASEKSAIARQYSRRFHDSNITQAAYAVQGEKAKLRLNRENQYNTLLSAGLAASGMQQWNSYQIQNSAPDIVINNILENAEKFLNDFGMTAQQNGEYTEEARKRAEAIVKKDEQLSNVYKQQATYYGRANQGVNRIQGALDTYNSKATVGVTMQQLKYMAKNYTAEEWTKGTAKELMDSLKGTLDLSEEKEILRDIDLLADNLVGNIRKGFLLSTEAAEKFSDKLEYVTSEDALGGFDKFLEKMSDLEKLMDEITSSSGMAFESTEKVIKTYPWLLYNEKGDTLSTGNITGNLIKFLGGNLSNSGTLIAQKAVSELWSGDLGTSVWSQFASQVKSGKIGDELPSGVHDIVTNSEYTTANSAFMAIMKNFGEGDAEKFNTLFTDFIKDIDLTEEYTAIYLKTIEKMNKWRTKMNENEISELESIKNNLSSVNSERERELKLIKAREALENAKNEKKRVYRTGKIMPLDNYIGQRPEVVKTEVRRFNRNRNDCRILLVTIILKLSPAYRQYTV